MTRRPATSSGSACRSLMTIAAIPGVVVGANASASTLEDAVGTAVVAHPGSHDAAAPTPNARATSRRFRLISPPRRQILERNAFVDAHILRQPEHTLGND